MLTPLAALLASLTFLGGAPFAQATAPLAGSAPRTIPIHYDGLSTGQRHPVLPSLSLPASFNVTYHGSAVQPTTKTIAVRGELGSVAGATYRALTDDAEIFVAAFKARSVNGYDAPDRKNRGPDCTVAGVKAVNAIGVDRSGTLWVPQQDGSTVNHITSYAPHCGAPGITLNDRKGFPFDIAFDSKGNNYVMDAQDFGSKPGDVLVFPKGAVEAAATLTDPALTFVTAVGVDRNDNVYAMYITHQKTGAIVEFPKGKMPGMPLAGVAVAGVPGGTLVFDQAGNLIVNDFSHATIDVFTPPFKGPPAQTPLIGTAWQCSLNPRGTRLACADYGKGSVDVYGYPSGDYRYSITAGLLRVQTVVGVAYAPSS